MPAAQERDGRSRSPGAGKTPLPKGHAVQFFLEEEASNKKALLLRPKGWSGSSPLLLQSHGWLDGTLAEAFDPATFDAEAEATWPLVLPRPDHAFESRGGKRAAGAPRRARKIREAVQRPPLFSAVFVRWGGKYSKWMDEQEANDGDWGKYGSPPSDEYMTAMIREGLLEHPQLGNDGGHLCSVEVFALFVKSSADVWNLGEKVKQLGSILKGKKRALFWMLWPAEWEDTGDPDFACYIERQSLFGGMRICEAAGLPSAFPHPADQFELITSKSWMATLSLDPRAHLPAAVLVGKDKVITDLACAARDALAGLEHIRKFSPFPRAPEDPPAPSDVNKDGVKKGVVKLGWSWENRFVAVFNGQKELEARLKAMMTQAGCTASMCIVQEWVDFDFEMRLYFLPPPSWAPGTLQPTRVECNAWGERRHDEEGTMGSSHASFTKMTEAMALSRWEGDQQAFDDAKVQATEVAQLLVAWLLSANARAVPMIRLDFMVKRIAPGRARVAFGEYCEMGACCLGWKEGPPTIWRAAVDAVLR